MSNRAARTPSSRTRRAPRASPARERILATAAKLFYERGVQAVGINEIIERSGVAKMSLYNNFDSKDALIVAYLRARHESWSAWLHAAVPANAAPRRRILAVFDALTEWCARDDFRGCAFLNTAAAICNPRHPVRAVCLEHKVWLRAYLQSLTAGGGVGDPAALAFQLVLLIDGAIAWAVLEGSSEPMVRAKAAAATLLKSA